MVWFSWKPLKIYWYILRLIKIDCWIQDICLSSNKVFNMKWHMIKPKTWLIVGFWWKTLSKKTHWYEYYVFEHIYQQPKPSLLYTFCIIRISTKIITNSEHILNESSVCSEFWANLRFSERLKTLGGGRIFFEFDNWTMSPWDALWSSGHIMRAMRGSHGRGRGSYKFENLTMSPWDSSCSQIFSWSHGESPRDHESPGVLMANAGHLWAPSITRGVVVVT